MYSMVCTRPDLAHSVSVVSRYMARAGREHWSGVKWILRYLKGSKQFGLLYDGRKENDKVVMGFVDSDFAGDLDNRRSLTGYVFQVYGCTVSWKASLQPVVALSTTEAEYIALTEAVKEALWIKGLLDELGVKTQAATVYCDSQSAIHLSKNQMFHERTKHIDVKLHFVRDILSKGSVKVDKIDTNDNPADMITKVVPLEKLKHCMELIRVMGYSED